MPHYRINIKLEQEPVREYLIEDDRREVEVVYHDYRRRVYSKNGAGRIAYFDLVMVSEESLRHPEDRKEVYNEKNNFGYKAPAPSNKMYKKKGRSNDSKFTLTERGRK